MYVSYEHYRVFYYVAKCGNVTQAAKLLLNNQPNVTRTIKNLEAELGCTLFSRSNRGMRLTTEGARLYEHIRIAFSHIEAADEEIQRRLAKVKHIRKDRTPALNRYAALVTSADQGAVLKTPEES